MMMMMMMMMTQGCIRYVEVETLSEGGLGCILCWR